MKLNLAIAGESPRSGYTNLDPLATGKNPLVTLGDVANLNEHVDDAECDEIIATDVIDFLPTHDVQNTINHWCKKIRQGGHIVIGGVDIREVCKALVNQEITLEEAGVLLYGQQRAPFDYRKGTLSMQTIISLLQQNDFKVVQKRVANYFYNVKAERQWDK